MMSILQSIIFMIIRLDLFGAVILDIELNDMAQTNLKLIQNNGSDLEPTYVHLGSKPLPS